MASAGDDERVLRAALLWARNHLDIGHPDVRQQVIATLDRVLQDHKPSVADLQLLRQRYPLGEP